MQALQRPVSLQRSAVRGLPIAALACFLQALPQVLVARESVGDVLQGENIVDDASFLCLVAFEVGIGSLRQPGFAFGADGPVALD